MVLQSDACFEAMQIEWPVIRQQAIQRGVIMTRVAVRDFDHNDQVGTSSTCMQHLHASTHSLQSDCHQAFLVLVYLQHAELISKCLLLA